MKKTTWACALFLIFTFSVHAKNASWDTYKKETLAYQKTIPGWCVPEKVYKLMDLVHKTKPKKVIEVGVFGGSSVYPIAQALKFNHNGGVIYAIDPWKEEACLEGYEPGDPNYEWWKNSSKLNKIYNGFVRMIHEKNLLNFCKTMRMTSVQAVDSFDDDSIDILHIDGNHTEERAYGDVVLYMPKLKKGGYLYLDDADWSSTHKAVDFLMENCEYLVEGSVILPQTKCLLFRKI